MKKLILLLTSFLLAANLYAQQGVNAADGGKVPERGLMVGGIGADGKYHFLLVGNDGGLTVSGGGGGTGDFTNATFNAAFGTAGTADSQVMSVQGISGGTALPVSLASVPSHAVTNAGTFAVQVSQAAGAANYANGQVTTSTTAGTLVAARATRRSVVLKNTDTAITVYIGAATVTAANGLALKPGESVPVDTTALIQVIAASGTPVVAYMETYD